MEPSSTTFSAFLNDQPWSFSRLIFDLDNLLDNEGRPLGERRARAGIRKDVAMEVKECPFEDGREGHLMNVSAYQQVSRYYGTVMAELAGFRDQGGDGWEDILASVIDQLSQPAWYVVDHPEMPLRGGMPGLNAVGHKLGAGLFGVMRDVVRMIATGKAPAPSSEFFSELVRKTGALKGASEVCAGPPSMIKHTLDVLFNGDYKEEIAVSERRVKVARILTAQVMLGAYWALLDQEYAAELLLGEFHDDIEAANAFLQGSLERAATDLAESATLACPDWNQLPEMVPTAFREDIEQVLGDGTSRPFSDRDVQDLQALIGSAGRVVRYHGDEPDQLALHCLQYLELYRLFSTQLTEMEYSIRDALGYDKNVGIELGRMVLPTPRALPWFERLAGHKLDRSSWRLTGSSNGLVIPGLVEKA